MMEMKEDEIDKLVFGIGVPKYVHDILKAESSLALNEAIQPGKDAICLIGYPCDIGTKLVHGRPGQERGPRILLIALDFFRQYVKSMKMPLQNTYYNVDIEKRLSLFDLGDVSVLGYSEKDLLLAHQSLLNLISSILSNGKTKVFVIGGSNDCSLSSAKSLINISKEKGWVAVHIDGGLDCNEEVKGIHSDSAYKQVHELAAEHNGQVFTLGCQAIRVHQDELEFVKSKGGKAYFLKKDIRGTFLNKPTKLTENIVLNTSSGQLLNQILSEAEKAGKAVLISWDSSSLQVDICPGVVNPSIVGGFTLQEAEEMALVIGKYRSVRIVEIVELNPTMEYHISYPTILKLFYLMLISQST